MKAWLKGGIIAAGIYIVFAIIMYGLFSIVDAESIIQNDYLRAFFVLPGLIIMGFIPGLNRCLFVFSESPSFCPGSTTLFILAVLFSLVTFFVIGAIVGLVVGKIRGRKEVQKEEVKKL